ncbi:hypothetical protein PAL_GLEAN10002905 [Pteropus alecto]|uniref:Uncharacterized protein n=1 Tax=Pteropus alecto TaxID=9402 RepID=L5JZ93_PTEAL|nr:hypothetical protein PAL_GLEAN10002905 [Pteropus alecto]
MARLTPELSTVTGKLRMSHSPPKEAAVAENLISGTGTCPLGRKGSGSAERWPGHGQKLQRCHLEVPPRGGQHPRCSVLEGDTHGQLTMEPGRRTDVPPARGAKAGGGMAAAASAGVGGRRLLRRWGREGTGTQPLDAGKQAELLIVFRLSRSIPQRHGKSPRCHLPPVWTEGLRLPGAGGRTRWGTAQQNRAKLAIEVRVAQEPTQTAPEARVPAHALQVTLV